jgi:hypothetical protein
MYGGEKAYISCEQRYPRPVHLFLDTRLLWSQITVTFDPTSTGQLALVLYEWSDVKYLGADSPGDDSMPVSSIRRAMGDFSPETSALLPHLENVHLHNIRDSVRIVHEGFTRIVHHYPSRGCRVEPDEPVHDRHSFRSDRQSGGRARAGRRHYDAPRSYQNPSSSSSYHLN